jgi:hypothetical protein
VCQTRKKKERAKNVTKKSIKQRSNIISEGRKGLFEKGKQTAEMFLQKERRK